jgi:hypothetical protein
LNIAPAQFEIEITGEFAKAKAAQKGGEPTDEEEGEEGDEQPAHEASNTTKIIGQAGDVVFAQIAAQLDFDDLYGLVGAIGQAMDLPGGNVAMLAHLQCDLLQAAVRLPESDDGCAAHDDPMLSTSGVFLQTDLLARMHANAFDFQAGRFVDGLIPAPRALGVFDGLGAVGGGAHMRRGYWAGSEGVAAVAFGETDQVQV